METLDELAWLDLELHHRWKEATRYHRELRAIPLQSRGRILHEPGTIKGSVTGSVWAAGENARYVGKAWRNLRDRRLAAGGKKLKYPEW